MQDHPTRWGTGGRKGHQGYSDPPLRYDRTPTAAPTALRPPPPAPQPLSQLSPTGLTFAALLSGIPLLQARAWGACHATHQSGARGRASTGRRGGGECGQAASNPVANNCRENCGAVPKPPQASKCNPSARGTHGAPTSEQGGRAKLQNCEKLRKIAELRKIAGIAGLNPPPPLHTARGSRAAAPKCERRETGGGGGH